MTRTQVRRPSFILAQSGDINLFDLPSSRPHHAADDTKVCPPNSEGSWAEGCESVGARWIDVELVVTGTEKENPTARL